ncbi:TonB-dependent receptor [candidate division WOR-3 bacterium]|nr:TonB-dependent receptor [candidate division WOR-3 bacterium]
MAKIVDSRQKAVDRSAAATLALLLVLGTAYAATLRGVVLDAVTGEPITYALVSTPEMEANAVADASGAFALALTVGTEHVTVVVSSVGYDEKRYDSLDASSEATLYLRPNPIHLKEITVTAFRTPSPVERSGPVSIVEVGESGAKGRTSVAELLTGLPSTFIKDYGNLAMVGLRGADAEQTLVLFDGVRLNSAQDNLSDLTTLPLSSAQRVEVVRGNNSALYGANSIGGLVNIIPPEPERLGARATAGLGSLGRRYLQATHTNWSDPLGYVVSASLNRTGAAFTYRDTADSARERVNSDINSQDVMAKGVFAQGRQRVSLLGEYNVTRRGVPGPTSWPADSARMDDYRGIVHLGYELQETDNARLESRLYHHQSWRHYRNPDTLAWVNDTHVTWVSGITAKQAAHFAGWMTGVVGLEGERAQFRSSAIGLPQRWTGAGWAEARIRWRALNVIPMARFDWLNDSRRRPDSVLTRSNTRIVSPKLTLSYSGPAWLDLYASVGRSFRTPTFNELYWPEDPWTRGNPQLKPEWATSIDLNAAARYGSSVSGRLGVWHSSLTDLIQWQPDSALVYRPVNLDTATITGSELELTVNSKHLRVAGHATYILARSHGKDLIYRPRFSLAVSHLLRWRLVQLSWDVRRTGKRYTVPDNTDSLPGFLLFDMGVGFTPTLGRLETALRGGVRNLFDRQYEVMKGYPVPGRNWYAELELKL